MKQTTDAGKKPARNVDGHSILIDQRYFRIEQWNSSLPSAANASADVVQMLFVAEGELTIEGKGFEPLVVERCQLCVIPAGAKGWTTTAKSTADVVRILPQSA